MCYELAPKSGRDLVRQVSKVAVSTGFDIASFETPSVEHELIEVNLLGFDRFRLSAYEAEVARRYSDKYYLYLVASKNTTA